MELGNTSGKSGKTWETQGILFDTVYFDFHNAATIVR